ncbi:restriction endonuclease [Desulfobulbus rhabdoformis]|uniref:nSTAND3 domain-containing NTPase n=1 Tax=Desulfobulbus rhabdoformis TaxID=34032 RepID=UPI001963AEBA|nr:restriction endonuclease [Desulfobulbus rhabdoformis]MBM9613509.1 restriction endonuclease [Desulfobulbus rhabdoformis]
MYYLENLSPQDFEELCCDILQSHLLIELERFKVGKDKGIDLRCLESDKSKIIIQVKHTPGSYGASHRSSLKKEYTSFLKHKHNPSRYILITSAKLSGENKKEINKIFNGLIKSDKDILGYEFIDDFLRNNPQILKQHYKLWLSNSETVSLILHNKVHGKSEDYLSGLLERKNYFVQTSSFSDGINLLKKKRTLLLLGDPGVGKTFHAELICLYYITKGYDFIYAESIDEAEEVYDKSKLQIFFIDDFMGANFLELFKENTENKILRFINRIQSSNEKYVIFCSRTTIFNSALQRAIHLNEKNIDKKKLILEISHYSNLNKAKILYNHLVYKKLNERYFDIIKNTKIYLDIVKHKNFNPRLVEFITTDELIEDSNDKEYLELVRYYLDHPSEIWHSAFENQLNNENRWLLQTLFTHGGSCEESVLEESFIKRVQFEIKNSNHVPTSSPYINSLKILLNGFVTRTISHSYTKKNTSTTVAVKNPSISDYLLSYFSGNSYLQHNTISSCVYFDQIKHLVKSNIINHCETAKIIDKILKNKLVFKSRKDNSFEEELLGLIFLSNFRIEFKIILELFQKCLSDIGNKNYQLLFDTLEYLINNYSVEFLIKHGLDIKNTFHVMLLNANDLDIIDRLIDDGSLLEFDVKAQFFVSPRKEIINKIYELCELEADVMLADDDDYYRALSPWEVESAADNVKCKLKSRVSDFNFINIEKLETFNINYDDIAIENEMRRNDDFFSSNSREGASDEDIMRVFSK